MRRGYQKGYNKGYYAGRNARDCRKEFHLASPGTAYQFDMHGIHIIMRNAIDKPRYWRLEVVE